jgi:hypothetical protein
LFFALFALDMLVVRWLYFALARRWLFFGCALSFALAALCFALLCALVWYLQGNKEKYLPVYELYIYPANSTPKFKFGRMV